MVTLWKICYWIVLAAFSTDRADPATDYHEYYLLFTFHLSTGSVGRDWEILWWWTESGLVETTCRERIQARRSPSSAQRGHRTQWGVVWKNCPNRQLTFSEMNKLKPKLFIHAYPQRMIVGAPTYSIHFWTMFDCACFNYIVNYVAIVTFNYNALFSIYVFHRFQLSVSGPSAFVYE